MTGLLCYVLGCHDHGYAGAIRSVRHAAFGRVASCQDHDPNRFDAGQSLVPMPAPVPSVAGQDRADGGHRVAIVRPVPSVPPAGVARPF